MSLRTEFWIMSQVIPGLTGGHGFQSDDGQIIIEGMKATGSVAAIGDMQPAGLIGLGERAMVQLAASHAKASVGLLSVNADLIRMPDQGSALTIRAEISRATRSVIFMSAVIQYGDATAMTLTALYKVAPAKV